MKIQAVKDNLDSSIKKLVPIQALSSSMDNLLVLLEEKLSSLCEVNGFGWQIEINSQYFRTYFKKV